MNLELKGKTAIVTGAASGIGQAIALAYAREGANLIVSDINDGGGQETVAQIKAASPDAQVIYLHADASKPEDHAALVKTALEDFGGLHIACNNAGIGGELNPVGDLSHAGWLKVIDVNLNGVYYAMHAQIPALLQSGGGSIVNIASILGQVGWAGASAYVAAKHGVVGLTQTAALEYSNQGIRVNAVGPGFIDTPILGALDEQARAGLASLHPIGRIGRVEEIADLVVYLSSARASLITGAYYNADGGYLAR